MNSLSNIFRFSNDFRSFIGKAGNLTSFFYFVLFSFSYTYECLMNTQRQTFACAHVWIIVWSSSGAVLLVGFELVAESLALDFTYRYFNFNVQKLVKRNISSTWNKQNFIDIVDIFSLRYLQNESDLPSTPPDCNMLISPNLVTSKTTLQPTSSKPIIKHQRSNSLSEINDTIFNIPLKDPLHKVKLPSLDQCRPLQKRKIYKNISLDNRK